MQRYIRSHLSDQALIQSAVTNAGRERTSTADLLADIAEIDERRLYAPAGYASTFAWCVGELSLSDDAAFRRITAARSARRFPAIFPALAEGRLHLAAVGLLAPYLTEETAKELLAASAHKTKSEIEHLLAERFPRTDVLAWVESLPTASASGQDRRTGADDQLVPGRVHDPVILGSFRDRSIVQPLSADSFRVQFTQCRRAHDKLEALRELLSHEIPSGDLAEVVEALCDIADPIVRKRRYAATARPRAGHRCPAAGSRHIPDAVQRAVWERDRGCCTFVSEDGHRCGSRKLIEYDHIEAFAKGGEATVDNVRLLCQAHNRYEADRTFGVDFMRHKRVAAAEARAAAKTHAKQVREQEAAAARARAAEEHAHELEVVPYLRALGCNDRESRDLAAHCRDMRDAPLDQRVRVALSHIHVRGTKKIPAFVTTMSNHGAVAVAPGP
jgi:5-methylcytosine-specific restriction endonuclease McrA